FLHDVYVRDGLAFLSHWNAGLIILDVGNGIAGGSPTSPVEVSRIRTQGDQTHNAWYWPEGGYVFTGEEDFGTPGRLHVIDVRDLAAPREVATFRVAGDTPHNFWLDEAGEVLYAAWYSAGVVAIDVSGELTGALEAQGRVLAISQYAGAGVCQSGAGSCTWAPQLHDGLVWVSDMNSGLWALEPEF
ncbi:MAG: LVIVD repeat-containing protein, partial [Gemmatimonadota bacterium]